jgi:cell division protease FtsH
VTRSQDYSEDTAQRIDAEVNKLLRDSYTRAQGIVKKNRDKLDMIASLLLERETLEGRDVEEIVHHGHILTEGEREKVDREKEEREKAKAEEPGAERPVPEQEAVPADVSPALGASRPA